MDSLVERRGTRARSGTRRQDKLSGRALRMGEPSGASLRRMTAPARRQPRQRPLPVRATGTLLRLLAALAMLVALPGGPVEAEPTAGLERLAFGIIATESTTGLKEGFEPFLARLEAKIGVPIDAFFAPDYAGVIEAMRFGKIQVAWFGNKSAIEAVDRAHGEVFAQTTDADGGLGYYSLIIVHHDSPFTDIDQIIAQGDQLAFGNGDPNSTSGYLIPTFYLWSKRGIDPRRHFRRMRHANHEANCMAVANRQVDFATNNTESVERFRLSSPELAANLRVIWQSPMIPKDPLVWRKDLPREWKARIKGVLLSFGRTGPEAAEERELLRAIFGGWGPFLDSDNRQLLPLRQLEIEKERQKVLHNDRLAEADRGSRLAEIAAEAAALERYVELDSLWNGVKYR